MERRQTQKILDVKELVRNYYTVNSQGETITYQVLKGISFTVMHGEFIGIMGSSGCGKTTLLKTLGMMNNPDDGEVLYKGVPTSDFQGDELAKVRRRELAFIFQDFYLMDSLTVEENIMMPLILNEDDTKRSKQTARRVAAQFGIERLLDKKPYELSGGEKQRTAICRAMAADPELILADEPTGNLDSKSGKIVVDALEEVNEKMGKTIIMVTHDPQVASCCKRIIFLKDGVILNDMRREGSKEEFYSEILTRMKEL